MSQMMNQSVEDAPGRKAADSCLGRLFLFGAVVVVAFIFFLGLLAGVVIAGL